MSAIGRISSGMLSKGKVDDAGQDIHSNEDLIIPSSSSAAVSTGLIIAVPKNHVGLVWPRSGTSFKNNIETGAGCIDANYRGEVKVKLYNHSTNTEFRVKKGDRIAQLLTIPIANAVYTQVDFLEDTERGDSGFGDSGR